MCKFCSDLEFRKKVNQCLDYSILTSVYIGDHAKVNDRYVLYTAPDLSYGPGYQLNYCPECGKELKESQRIDTENLVREIESLIAENREILERVKDRMEIGKW